DRRPFGIGEPDAAQGQPPAGRAGRQGGPRPPAPPPPAPAPPTPPPPRPSPPGPAPGGPLPWPGSWPAGPGPGSARTGSTGRRARPAASPGSAAHWSPPLPPATAPARPRPP